MNTSELDWMLRFSCTLLGVGKIISSMECFALLPEHEKGGMFDWAVLRQHDRFGFRGVKVLTDVLYGSSGMRTLTALNLFIGLFLLLSFAAPKLVLVLCLWALVIASIVILLRAPVGQEGSDQMMLIVAIPLACGSALAEFPGVFFACHLFIAGQLILSYFVAGVAKLFGDVWRSGYAIERILLSDAFGTPAVGKWLLLRKNISRFVCWTVVGFECLFPLVLFIPSNFVWIFLGIALLFHIGNAMLMGLNGFLWPFVAAYPSLIYVTQIVWK